MPAYATLNKSSHSAYESSPAAAEVYADLNQSFAEHWKAHTGVDVSVGQGLSKSGRPVHVTLDGLDVTTLALSYDAAKLGEKNRFIAPSLSKFLSHDTTDNLSRASPYTSTIVFLVRKGNPKEVNDWDDLLHSEIEVVMPDPRISVVDGIIWQHGDMRSGNRAATKQVHSTSCEAAGQRNTTGL